MPKAEESTPASSTAATAEADDDLGDPDVLADVMADPEFLKQVNKLSSCFILIEIYNSNHL